MKPATLNRPRRRAARSAAARYFAGISRAERQLHQLGLPLPGGDGHPRDVLVGVDSILNRIKPRDRFERLAMEWLDIFRRAGAPMLPAREKTMRRKKSARGSS